MYSMDRRPPIHHRLPDSYGIASNSMHRQDALIRESFIDTSGLHALDQPEDDDDEFPQNDKNDLDYLAIDVAERYLDGIYQEDEDEDANIDNNKPAPTGNQSGLPSIWRAKMMNPNGEKKLTDKKLAWQKVRQLLIEEEQAAQRGGQCSSVNKAESESSTVSHTSDESCDTVKLLDYLVQTTDGSGYSRSIQSEDEANPSVDRTRAKSRQYYPPLPFRHKEDDELASGRKSAQMELMTMLDQITRICQNTEFSEAAIARIVSRLASIDQIAREDMYKISHHRRGSLQNSTYSTAPSMTWSRSDYQVSDYDPNSRGPTPAETLQLPPGLRHNSFRNDVSSSVLNSFKAFGAAHDLGDTLRTFNKLMVDCGLNGMKIDEPWHIYTHIKSAVYNKLGFRQRQLFKLLDTRFNLDVYKRRPAVGKRVCIIGAGPVGLRAALEIVMLGGQAVVLEKRTNFVRENMLHLWPWVVQDLASLGARILFSHFCRSRVYFHVSTRQLQVILLKVSLLVGVKVHTETEFRAFVEPSSGENGKPFYTVVTKPQIPMVEFTAVLGASGTNDKLAPYAGINRFVFSRREALGIVCYFPNLGTSEETKVKEFSWTQQLKRHMLDKMRKVGLDLENIMYYRGEMHYLVMTPRRQNLLDRRVVNVNHENPKELVKDDNVNEAALYHYADSVVKFAGIARKTDFSRVNLFDFSSRTRADKAANVISCNGKKLYVGVIGDSLLEPLWHEGVGTCRGFLGALDTVWMVAQIGRKSDEQLLAYRDLAYQVMQRLTGHYRDEMQKNVRKYTADPRSRYTVNFPQFH